MTTLASDPPAPAGHVPASEAEARRILEAFKRESARFGQGAAMP